MFSRSIIVVLALLIVHFLGCYFFVPNFSISNFIASHLSQAILSIIILMVLLQVEKKSKDQLGYVFLGLTSAKVIISFVIAKQFLFQGVIIEKEIKVNFFIAFLIFLCLDAYFVIRLLNKK